MKKITFIEPLFQKIIQLATSGQSDCLQKALSLYGSERDISTLIESIENKHTSDKDALILIDFLPLMSLGTRNRLTKLEKLYERIPFVIVAKKALVFEQPETLKNISLIVCDNNLKIREMLFAGRWKKNLSKSISLRMKKDDYILPFHSKHTEEFLLNLIPDCIRKPPENSRQDKLEPLPDGAWANQWIDVKKILSNPKLAFNIAYQMGYILTNAYTEELYEHGFVVGNNTAYVLASFIQIIFSDKDLIMIDKLGPFPKLSKTRLLGIKNIENKKFCMIEDVISTGRELDLTQLIVYLKDSLIERVITLFDLEIASSRLINHKNVYTLCKPSKVIKYKRFPKHVKKQGAPEQ